MTLVDSVEHIGLVVLLDIEVHCHYNICNKVWIIYTLFSFRLVANEDVVGAVMLGVFWSFRGLAVQHYSGHLGAYLFLKEAVLLA